jgi:hypothetical protein
LVVIRRAGLASSEPPEGDSPRRHKEPQEVFSERGASWWLGVLVVKKKGFLVLGGFAALR